MGTAQLPPVPDFEAIEHKAQANVERQTAILTLIGNLVLSWSNNESMFIYVLMVRLEVDEVTAAVVFTTLNTTRARIDLVQRLAAIKLADRAAAQKLEKIVKRFNDLTRIRNEFNHSMYALNEAGEITHMNLIKVQENKGRLKFGERIEMDQARIDKMLAAIRDLKKLNREIWGFLPQLREAVEAAKRPDARGSA
jgi:DNA integrity scanning protein DisA with diadenylate cyclase activity